MKYIQNKAQVPIQAKISGTWLKTTLVTLITAFFMLIFLSNSAYASKNKESFLKPGGPYANSKQTFENLSALHTYDELVAKLKKIAETSDRVTVGAVIDLVDTDVDVLETIVKSILPANPPQPVIDFLVSRIGMSNQGEVIYGARLGEGDKKIMLVAQQHGNEFHSGEASLKFIKWLATSGSKAAKKILAESAI